MNDNEPFTPVSAAGIIIALLLLAGMAGLIIVCARVGYSDATALLQGRNQ